MTSTRWCSDALASPHPSLDTFRASHRLSSIALHKRLAAAHNNLGAALHEQGDREGASDHYCEVVCLRMEVIRSDVGGSSRPLAMIRKEASKSLVEAALREERMVRARTTVTGRPAHLDLYRLPECQDDEEESNREIDETYYLPHTSDLLIENSACDDQLESSVTLFNMALLHSQESNADKSSDLLSIAEGLTAKSADTIKASAVFNGAARIHYTGGNLDGAASALAQAVRLQQRRPSSTPRPLNDGAGASLEASVADTLSLLGRIHLDQGGDGPSRALLFAQEALRLHRSAFGDDHISVAASLHNVGIVLAANGDSEGALEHCEYFIRSASQCVETSQYALHIANALDAVGAICLQGGQSGPHVIESLTRSLELWQLAEGPSHPSVVALAVRLGQALHDMGRFQDALTVFGDALKVAADVYGHQHELYAAVLCQVGKTQHALGDLDAALESYEEVLVTARMLFGDADAFVAHMLGAVGNVHLERGETEDAMANFADASRIARHIEAAAASDEVQMASENGPSLEQVLGMEFHPAAAAA